MQLKMTIAIKQMPRRNTSMETKKIQKKPKAL